MYFAGAERGVTVDLRKGSARGQGRDRLFFIQHVAGSANAAVSYGNHKKNTFQGRPGSDIILLGGGDDRSGGLRRDCPAPWRRGGSGRPAGRKPTIAASTRRGRQARGGAVVM